MSSNSQDPRNFDQELAVIKVQAAKEIEVEKERAKQALQLERTKGRTQLVLAAIGAIVALFPVYFAGKSNASVSPADGGVTQSQPPNNVSVKAKSTAAAPTSGTSEENARLAKENAALAAEKDSLTQALKKSQDLLLRAAPQLELNGKRGPIAIRGGSPFTFLSPGTGSIQITAPKNGEASIVVVRLKAGSVGEDGRTPLVANEKTAQLSVSDRDFVRCDWKSDGSIPKLEFSPSK
jgi:hypothetical protein